MKKKWNPFSLYSKQNEQKLVVKAKHHNCSHCKSFQWNLLSQAWPTLSLINKVCTVHINSQYDNQDQDLTHY